MLSITQGHRPQYLEWLGRNLREQYWGSHYTDPMLARALQNSMSFWLVERVNGVVVGEPLGFARVVSDSSVFSSLMDVFVVPERRGQGGGRMLVNVAVSHPAVWRTICICASRDAAGLYMKFGFRPIGGDVMQRNPGKPAVPPDPRMPK